MPKPASFSSFLFIVVFLGLFAGCQTPPPQDPAEVTLTIAGGAAGQDLDLTVDGTRRFMEANPEVEVVVRPVPISGEGRLSFYHSLFDRESPDVDILQVDVVWMGIVAAHALDLREQIDSSEIEKHFESVIRNNTVDGALVAMPWFIEMPHIYYRSDLLEKYGYPDPPQTWDELEEMAVRIEEGERSEGNLGFWGYVWQGRPYEGLTCNALEWQMSHGGGNFVSDQGNANLTQEGTVEAFSRAASWIGSISPPQVLEFAEEESRLMWMQGDAAFLRNWSSVYAEARDSNLSGSFGVAPVPEGPAGRAATMGGWHLMVSRYSRHPEVAAELVRFLSSEAEQKRRAIDGSYSPTIRSLYEDPEVLGAVPFFEGFEDALEGLVARPSSQVGAKYHRVSSLYSQTVHSILQGQNAMERLEAAEQELDRVID